MEETSPKTLVELKNAIAAQQASLSKRLGQIAKYIVASPDKIAFGTVAVIAEDAGVHPSTLVRFAHAFGYRGFTEMQQLFRQQLIQESPSYNDRIRIAREAHNEEADSPKGLLNQFVSANATAIESRHTRVLTKRGCYFIGQCTDNLHRWCETGIYGGKLFCPHSSSD